MLRLTFTDEQIGQLRTERFTYPHPRVQRKMEALFLKSQGQRHKDIGRLVGVTENTVRDWLREFQAEGVAGLKRFQQREKSGALRRQQTTLDAEFRAHPPCSTREAQRRIAELTGVKRGPTQVRKFMKEIGMGYRKTGLLPAKLDVAVQEAFKKKTWNHG